MRNSIRRRSPVDVPAPVSAAAAEQRQLQLLAVRVAALAGCSLAAFAVPAVLVPWRSERVRIVIIAALILITAASGLAGGRPSGVLAAVMSACSLDFFHDSTLRVLSLDTAQFWGWTAIFVGTGLVSATAAAAGRGLARGRD